MDQLEPFTEWEKESLKLGKKEKQKIAARLFMMMFSLGGKYKNQGNKAKRSHLPHWIAVNLVSAALQNRSILQTGQL